MGLGIPEMNSIVLTDCSIKSYVLIRTFKIVEEIFGIRTGQGRRLTLLSNDPAMGERSAGGDV